MTFNVRSIRRQAFTLVELLVVIAILAILAGLASWAVIAMVGTQSARNTENTIKTVNKVLQTQWKFVIDEAKKDDISGNVAVQNLAAPDPDGRRAKVLWIKLRLMEAFPQKYSDILNPPVYGPDPGGNVYIPLGMRRYNTSYQKALASPPFVPASNQLATQSAACLLIALSVKKGGVDLTPDQIGYAADDTDKDGVKELIDGWRKPFVFTRFTLAPNPATGGANVKFADPLDPEGLLLSNTWYGPAQTNWYGGSASTGFESLAGYAISNGVNANYVTYGIASPGKDGIPGTPDDIISFKLRLD
jgi:prepilin-type N-terminal cleavage/methylation domain-containing protein